jgi:hypothetical protein
MFVSCCQRFWTDQVGPTDNDATVDFVIKDIAHPCGYQLSLIAEL